MTRPALSISTSFDYGLSIEEQLPLVAEAGFTHVSLGGREGHSAYLSVEGRRTLGRLLRQSGLALDTIHGPRADRPEAVATLLAVAQAAAELSAPVVVVHGGPFGFGADELPARVNALVRTCEALAPALAQAGVVCALENVLPGPATDLIRQALPRLDPERFGFCYDSAHDQIGGPRPFTLLAELRDRVAAVHLSDRVRDFVDHVIPGEGFIDWDRLAEELRASRFAGPLLLEVMVTHSAEQDARRFLRLAHARGCDIHRRVFGDRPRDRGCLPDGYLA